MVDAPFTIISNLNFLPFYITGIVVNATYLLIIKFVLETFFITSIVVNVYLSILFKFEFKGFLHHVNLICGGCSLHYYFTFDLEISLSPSSIVVDILYTIISNLNCLHFTPLIYGWCLFSYYFKFEIETYFICLHYLRMFYQNSYLITYIS